jgi:hypothetical protein
MRPSARAILPLLVIVAGFAAAYHAEGRANSLRSDQVETDVLYVPRPDVLKVLSSGYGDLLSDFYWLRTVTYYGEWRQGTHGIRFFRELLSTVVTLDPNFTEAYRFGSIVLADDMGAFEEGIEFLRLGMEVMPDNWWLPFEAGFLEYTLQRNDEAAYEWFQRAGRLEGAPDMPRRFAAFVASRAGKLEVSYELWRIVAETTTSPSMRAKALDYMEQLERAIKGEGPIPDWAKPRKVVKPEGELGDA